MRQHDGRKRSALVGALLCALGVVLAALPALGLQLAPRPQAADPAYTSRAGSVDSVFLSHVRITGRVQAPLSPGMSSPIALSIRNGSSTTVHTLRVRVKVRKVIAPHATEAHPCTRMDFQIDQMHPQPLTIPKGRSDLARMGLAVSSWPTLSMRNRPMNQDGCKGAHLVLAFRALKAP
jgi:hypothetical protein